MRSYSIKRGHNADINTLLKKYFGVDGDINSGVEFYVELMGKIYMKKEGNNLIVETTPEEVHNDEAMHKYEEMMKKWNQFLYEATGRTAKERRKLLEKEMMK